MHKLVLAEVRSTNVVRLAPQSERGATAPHVPTRRSPPVNHISEVRAVVAAPAAPPPAAVADVGQALELARQIEAFLRAEQDRAGAAESTSLRIASAMALGLIDQLADLHSDPAAPGYGLTPRPDAR